MSDSTKLISVKFMTTNASPKVNKIVYRATNEPIFDSDWFEASNFGKSRLVFSKAKCTPSKNNRSRCNDHTKVKEIELVEDGEEPKPF